MKKSELIYYFESLQYLPFTSKNIRQKENSIFKTCKHFILGTQNGLDKGKIKIKHVSIYVE